MACVVRVTVESSLATEAVNTTHWRIPESAPTTEVNGIIGALDAFYEAVKTYLYGMTLTTGARVVTVDQNPNRLIPSTPLTCTPSGGTPAPFQAAVVCGLYATEIGPRYRGRFYLGPLLVGAIGTTGTAPSAAATTTIQTALTTLAAFSTNGVQMVVWSRKFQTYEEVATAVVSQTLGTQRRRLY